MYNEPLFSEKLEEPRPGVVPSSQNNVLNAEIATIRESVDRMSEQVDADLAQLRARMRTDEQERDLESASLKRTTICLGLLVLLLGVALFTAAGYGLPMLKNHSTLLSQISRLQGSFTSLAMRTETAEEQLRSWTSEEASLGKRLTNAEKTAAADLQLARRDSHQFASQMGQRLEAEMTRRLEPLFARLGRIESSQETEQARLEQLRTELGTLRSETAQQLESLRQNNSRQVAEVSQREVSGPSEVQEVGNPVNPDRVAFEVVRYRSREVIPGISVRVMKTDPNYQRVDGYIQMLDDGHTLWMRGQEIEQPVSFFSKKDSRPYELVFSRVNKDSVVGYIRVPANTSNKSTAAVADPHSGEQIRQEALNR